MQQTPRLASITATLVATLTLLCAAPNAWAQAKSFEGVDLSIQLGFHDVTATRTFLGGDTKGRSSNYTAQAQFSVALGEKFVLGLGAWRSLSDAYLGDIDYNNGVIDSLKMRDMYSVYIAPGYAINDNVLLYGKLGTLSGKWEEPIMTLNMSGTSFGLGVQIMGNQHLLYRLEVLQNKFDNKSFTPPYASGPGIAKLNATSFNAGLGYKF